MLELALACACLFAAAFIFGIQLLAAKHEIEELNHEAEQRFREFDQYRRVHAGQSFDWPRKVK